MTQDNYNNYVNIVRARQIDLANRVVDAYAIGDYTYFEKGTYDLAIIDIHLELMEEYELPLKTIVNDDDYECPNFLTHLEMQSADTLVQSLLNLNFQIDFLLDSNNFSYIIDYNDRPVVTITGEYLMAANGNGTPVYLKDALKDPLNVEYIYATAGYKLDGGTDTQVLTSDDDGMGTWKDSSSGGNSGLEYEIESERNVGGIYIGDVFVANSSITDLLHKLLVGLDLLSFDVDITEPYIEVGVAVAPVKAFWDTIGVFDVLTLENTLNLSSPLDVSGLYEHTYGTGESFVLNTNGSVTWKITATTGIVSENMSTTRHWVHPSYYGFNQDGSLPTEPDFIDKLIVPSSGGVRFPMRTTPDDWGWFAVPKDQTGKIYTEWDSTFCGNDQNKSTIGPDSFIDYKGTIDNIGPENITYDIYQYTENSMLDCDILLK